VINIIIIAGAIACQIAFYAGRSASDVIKLVKTSTAFGLFLAISVVVIVIAIVGIVSLCCPGKCCRGLYMGIIIIALVLEIVGVVAAYTFRGKIENFVKKQWEKPSNSKIRKQLEEANKCCGYDTLVLADCGFNGSTTATLPCREALRDDIQHNLDMVKVAVIVVLVLQVILLACAVYLFVLRMMGF
jgi:hypothetical protein